MARKIRAAKFRSVTKSLRRCNVHVSDQSEVWKEIHYMDEKTGAHSPTGAMRDSYEKRRSDLEKCLGAFPVAEESKQHGLLVLIGSRAVGMDVLSRADAYLEVHPKLIRSYAMEALTASSADSRPIKDDKAREIAESFLSDCRNAEKETQHSTPGEGVDYRYGGKRVAGAALVSRETAPHLAFFPAEEASSSDGAASGHHFGMAGYRSRRGFRR